MKRNEAEIKGKAPEETEKRRRRMSVRFFPNPMPSFVEESEESTSASGSLQRLLLLPYHHAARNFLQAATDLKQKVLKKTWVNVGHRVNDFTLYTGALGTAYLLLKAYEVTKDKNDLEICNQIIRACDSASKGTNYVTFICGRSGICALEAVSAKYSGDEALLDHYISSFKEIKLPTNIPNELLYGRAGYLWAYTFLNEYIGLQAFPSSEVAAVAKDIINEGKRLANNGSCPLMFEWHDKKYWGAAHGLAGIMNVLMDMSLSPEEQELVKGTLFYMIQNRFTSGNYPSSEGANEADDRLVHWCHGAPGVALTLAKAARVFEEKQFLQAAIDAADVVWNRGLLRRVGICHGVSGNAYVFLSLYRLTGNKEQLYRAKAFASFLLDRADQLIGNGEMHAGDRPYSLFEGQAGMAALFYDMARPSASRFPAYEI